MCVARERWNNNAVMQRTKVAHDHAAVRRQEKVAPTDVTSSTREGNESGGGGHLQRDIAVDNLF